MTSTSRAIHPGAKAHYINALSYEARYAARSEDVDYYLKAVPAGSRVLEYGAGAGRLTLKLIEKGVHVCAVDASEQMIELLRIRRDELPRERRQLIKLRCADMRSFGTTERYDFVIAAFHTLGHLYSTSDMASFLKKAFTHLVPGGKLLFDLPLPRIDMPEYDPLAGVRVTEMDGPDGPELLTQRWYQPAEISMHLHYAGFRKIRLSSDFTSAALDGETSVYVVSGTKPNAHAP